MNRHFMSFLIVQALVQVQIHNSWIHEAALVEDYAFHWEESEGSFPSKEEAVSWRLLLMFIPKCRVYRDIHGQVVIILKSLHLGGAEPFLQSKDLCPNINISIAGCSSNYSPIDTIGQHVSISSHMCSLTLLSFRPGKGKRDPQSQIGKDGEAMAFLSKIFLISRQALIATPFVRIPRLNCRNMWRASCPWIILDTCGHNLLRRCSDLNQSLHLISGRPPDGIVTVVERLEFQKREFWNVILRVFSRRFRLKW